MKPTVLVVIPTYNGVGFIKLTIDSLKAQTYSKVAVIAIDNCSTDGTPELLEELGVSVIRNEKNLGRIGNWNRALEVFRGSGYEYCKLVFTGDTLEPECIKRQMQEMKRGIQVVSCSHRVKTEKGGIADYVMNHIGNIEKIRCIPEQSLQMSLDKGNWLAGTTACMLFHRDAVSTRKFTAGLDWAGDWKFWAEMARYNEVVYLSEVLANFYMDARRGYTHLAGTPQAEVEEKTVRGYIKDVLINSLNYEKEQ